MAKTAFFALLESSKLISRKFSVTELQKDSKDLAKILTLNQELDKNLLKFNKNELTFTSFQTDVQTQTENTSLFQQNN